MSQTGISPETTSQVVYRSRVSVQANPGGIKLITLPEESAPVAMGMHGAIAAHYKLAEGAFTPRASTLDYVVGATAGCLMGTLNRAFQVRNIATDPAHLQAEAVGEIESDEGVLVIRRIRMIVHLKAEGAQREAAERVIAVYAPKCPVYRSLYKAIEITTELDFQPVDA